MKKQDFIDETTISFGAWAAKILDPSQAGYTYQYHPLSHRTAIESATKVEESQTQIWHCYESAELQLIHADYKTNASVVVALIEYLEQNP